MEIHYTTLKYSYLILNLSPSIMNLRIKISTISQDLPCISRIHTYLHSTLLILCPKKSAMCCKRTLMKLRLRQCKEKSSDEKTLQSFKECVVNFCLETIICLWYYSFCNIFVSTAESMQKALNPTLL